MKRLFSRTFMILMAMGALSNLVVPAGAFAFDLSSPAFTSGGQIPPQYTCTGPDQSPALRWSRAPAGVQSFALIADDPDAPSGTFVHWIVFNLPASADGIPEAAPKDPRLTNGGIQGTNGFGAIGYKGPCPPPGGPHHYHFKLFALDSRLELTSATQAPMLQSAMNGHIKGNAELIGTFSR